jgi:adenylate cyclase
MGVFSPTVTWEKRALFAISKERTDPGELPLTTNTSIAGPQQGAEMIQGHNGELIPVGGGDNIPLLRSSLTIGRGESCDICLRFPNVSSLHCELNFARGHWLIRDLGSTNGIKVNGLRVHKKVLHPQDTIMIGKRQYTIEYVPTVVQRLEEILEEEEDIFSQPLLERAGLVRPPRAQKLARPDVPPPEAPASDADAEAPV